MDCSSTKLPYRKTGYFSSLIVDYLDAVPALQEFYEHKPNTEGFKKAIDNRSSVSTNRANLVEHLNNQYNNIRTSAAVKANIAALAEDSTFTVCTAHQPALFTGTLYFV